MSRPRCVIDNTNVIYEFTCPMKDCCLLPKNNKYIGLTQCTLSRRFTYHFQNGSIINHAKLCQIPNLNRNKLLDNTKIIYKINNNNKLEILESILIKIKDPEINKQETGKHRILQLWT